MKFDEVQAIVVATVAETFDADPTSITDTTVADEVDGWDSLGHSVLMIRLGKRLGRPVPESIASEAKNVGSLTRMLTAYLLEA